ncbi:MAG: hypothetical protein KGL39_07280 [Patescibacteria group bacterium]|nr:hypothetical protein [Patescibacteria group bacterium]
MSDWLDLEPAAPQKSPSAPAAPPADDEWLNIEDPNAGKTTAAFQHLVNACMRGTDRVMACDGEYLAYRPFNRQFDKETNPRTKERMAMFLEKGFYTHLGTYDEVQVYRLEPGNPYRHTAKQYIVGRDRWADIRKAATAAIHRAWADYHDILGAMATAIKSGRDPLLAKAMWEDTVNLVAVAIDQMRQGNPDAPTEKEVNEGFVGVRRDRGIQGRNGVVLLNSDALQKVRMK